MRSWVILGTLILAKSAVAGEMLTFEDKALGADRILELRLILDKPIPRDWPNQTYDPKGAAFPEVLSAAGLKTAVVERVLLDKTPDSASPSVPGTLYVFGTSSPCWWKAQAAGQLRTLVFLKRAEDGMFRQLAGVEHEWGLYTDLNPNYAQLAQAIESLAGWREERMRAVDSSLLWSAQKTALKDLNPYRSALAAQFLRQHEAAAVVDEVLGPEAASKARTAATGLSTGNVCKP